MSEYGWKKDKPHHLTDAGYLINYVPRVTRKFSGDTPQGKILLEKLRRDGVLDSMIKIDHKDVDGLEEAKGAFSERISFVFSVRKKRG